MEHYPGLLPRWAHRALLVIALGSAAAFLLLPGLRHSGRLSDFAGYYTASRIVLSGDSVEDLYNDRRFIDRMQTWGLRDTQMIFYVNPPPASLIMTPVAWLDPGKAKGVWNLAMAALVFAALLFARKSMPWSGRAGFTEIFLACSFCSIPFMRNMQRGQIYVLMALLVLVLWQGYSTRNAWLTGLALAALLLLKYFGWIFLLLFAVERRWKEMGVTVIIVAAASILLAAAIGGDVYTAHLSLLASSFSNMDLATTGLPSIPALIAGLFVAVPGWNPQPVLNLPGLAVILTLVALCGMIAATLYRRSGRPAQESSPYMFFATAVLSVLLTPLAAEHHYVILAAPLVVMLTSPVRVSVPRILFAALTAYLLLGWLPLFPAGSLAGWTKLLGYGRLAGGLMLWYAMVRMGVYTAPDGGGVIKHAPTRVSRQPEDGR